MLEKILLGLHEKFIIFLPKQNPNRQFIERQTLAAKTKTARKKADVESN